MPHQNLIEISCDANDQPSQEFCASFALGKQFIVAQTTDLYDLSVVEVFRRLRNKYHMPVCFESALSHADRARHTIIALDPDIIWKVVGSVAQVAYSPNLNEFQQESCPPLQSLRNLISHCRCDLPKEAPDVASGLFGYLGYDLVRQMENLPGKYQESDQPTALLMRPKLTATFDLATGQCQLYRMVVPSNAATHSSDDLAQRAWINARDDLNRLRGNIATPLQDEADWQSHLDRALKSTPVFTAADNSLSDKHIGTVSVQTPSDTDSKGVITANLSKQQYCDLVQRCREYIHAGDAFQVVVSQRLRREFSADPLSFYAVLREVNPSPYLFFLEIDGVTIAGSSPEILVRYRDGEVTVRPLAGTIHRGTTEEEDNTLQNQLLSDPKERAEHLMLLDLGRNDVGRVSVAGGVKVERQFEVEKYSTVMHIVSDVVGQAKPECDAIDALVAGFPAGTLSGAPKIRAMEIIDELEPTPREIYSGAVGYFSASGNMETCIAIRTAVFSQNVMTVQAGAGLVADSQPESEHNECWNKALALLRSAAKADYGWS